MPRKVTLTPQASKRKRKASREAPGEAVPENVAENSILNRENATTSDEPQEPQAAGGAVPENVAEDRFQHRENPSTSDEPQEPQASTSRRVQPTRQSKRHPAPIPGQSIAQRVVSRSRQQNQATPINRPQQVDDIARSILHRRQAENLPSTYSCARLQRAHIDVEFHSVGNMDSLCQYCKAKLFHGEISSASASICCHRGKVSLPDLSVPPCLKELIEKNDSKTHNYLEHIRQYNNAFAFASVKVGLANIPGRGPFCFKIHGKVYHSVGSLNVPEGQTPSYASMFIIDSSEALQLRLNRAENLQCSEEVMALLQNMIETCNPYAHLFQSMKDITIPTQQLQLHFTVDNAFDRRRYNLPTSADEIAAVFTSNDSAPPENFEFVVYKKATGQLTMISYLNPHCDPMCYPLLFPCGDAGWRPGMPHVEIHRTNVRQITTQLQYYCFILAQREGFSLLHASGKLFQQFVVDSYVKVEGGRIAYIKSHQKQLRAENYKGLVDFMHSDATERGLLAGIPVILPSSFIGSPRNMLQNYQDAMSIVARLGKPDIFLTFTANPKWPEIASNLKPYETVHGRPDLVTRVFYLKLMDLFDDLQKKHVLGIVSAFVDVIEFQKRGLPHVHMLLILRAEDKIREPADVDSIVSAELPNLEDNEKLRTVIKQCMIHGPCGDLNAQSPCMVDGQCSKGFPKPFNPQTVLNDNGYPNYRRRNDGNTIRVGNFIVDNRWVVPFNPYLSNKYGAHINVEICSSVKSVKYLYKYVYKGHDCSTIRVHSNTEGQQSTHLDETEVFLDCRYISPPEAMWRLHERPLFNKSHTITRLPVHLEEEQNVVFETMEDAEHNMQKETKLTAFFTLCQQNEQARQYLYPEIPEHFVWNRNKWTPRKRFTRCFGRLYSVCPTDKERYALRLLLLHIKGPTSFQELKTVDGITHATFTEAATHLNLLNNDEEWRKCLQEAVVFRMPKQLRELFAIICIFGPAYNASELWEEFKEHLSEELIRQHGEETGYRRALAHIDSILKIHGKTFRDFGLPTPSDDPYLEEVPLVDQQELILEASRLFEQLNREQRDIAEEVLQAIESNRQCSFFIDGPGGTGKTFLYNTLTKILQSRQKTVVTVAWTGIAARLLPKGKTAHTQFKLPVPILDTSVSSIRENSQEAQDLRNASLIIWDEVSMVPRQALTIIDKLLKQLTKLDAPLGGKIFLFGGDFRQVLPVVRNGNRTKIVESSVKYSPLWQHLTIRKLRINMRANEDQPFANWLLKLGEGTLPTEDSVTTNSIAIPKDCFSPREDFIKTIFTEETINDSNINRFQNTAILCAKNDDCFKINDDVVMTLLEGPSKTYYSTDTVTCEDPRDENLYPQEFLNSLNPSGLPPHKLILKKNSIIMLIRNLNSRQGLVNGTRLVVQELHEHNIIARIVDSDHTIIIPRINLNPSDPTMPFNLNRKQFPIKVAFAMTINKAQGQTLNKAGLFLPQPVFSHGQLYVAFSRVRNFSNIKVSVVEGPQQKILEDKIITSNIVYKEIL